MNHPTLVVRDINGSFHNGWGGWTAYIGRAYMYHSPDAFADARNLGTHAEVYLTKSVDGYSFTFHKLTTQQYGRCMKTMKLRGIVKRAEMTVW